MIGDMPDELSKMIQDFIRPTEAYEVVLEQDCANTNAVVKRFRNKQDADKCYRNLKIPEDGEDYTCSIYRTYPELKLLHSCSYAHCQKCAEMVEVGDVGFECSDCNRIFCENCCFYEANAWNCYECFPPNMQITEVIHGDDSAMFGGEVFVINVDGEED